MPSNHYLVQTDLRARGATATIALHKLYISCALSREYSPKKQLSSMSQPANILIAGGGIAQDTATQKAAVPAVFAESGLDAPRLMAGMHAADDF
jgi:hypothetical protein